MAITFERNIVERAVNLQVERGDFDGSKTLLFAQFTRPKPFQKRTNIWFAQKKLFLSRYNVRTFLKGLGSSYRGK